MQNLIMQQYSINSTMWEELLLPMPLPMAKATDSLDLITNVNNRMWLATKVVT